MAQSSPADLTRRCLLIPITALLVARPLVFGEDPGLLAAQPDTSSMILGLLWLLTAVAWAAWRMWAGRGEWYVGAVEVALLAAVGMHFLSAEAAAYQHPARLIAWEWLVLLLAVVVVRNMASSPAVRHGLLAVFLATGAMLAVQGLMQAGAQIGLAHHGSQGYVPVFGTFKQPSIYAGFLALVLPGLIGAVLVCRRNGGSSRIGQLAALFAMAGIAALCLTRSAAAISALLLVALGAMAFRWRRHLRTRPVLTLFATVAGVGVLATVISLSGGGEQAALQKSSLFSCWSATTKMIADQPWLGVGPGNFGGFYSRYMAAMTPDRFADPHNFALELWAIGGVFTLIAVLIALAAFAVRVFRSMQLEDKPLEEESQGPVVRWEYYIGATIGLLLGFGLRLTVLAFREQVLVEGFASAMRSVVWFLAFAVFERIHWTDRQRCLALTAGITALLLHLLVSPGMEFPSLAAPLWTAIALALASLQLAPRVITRWQLPSRVLPLPVLAAAAVVYLVFVLYPTSSARSLMAGALDPNLFLQQRQRVFSKDAASIVGLPATQGAGQPLAAMATLHVHTRYLSARSNDTRRLIEGQMLRLQEVIELDPGNAVAWRQLGEWSSQYWEYVHNQKTADAAMSALRAAEKLDPNDIGSVEAQVQLWLAFARVSDKQADVFRRLKAAVPTARQLTAADKQVKLEQIGKREMISRHTAGEHRRRAVVALRRAIVIDPTDAPLRFRLAELLEQAGDSARCQQEAREAVSLDALATTPQRSLTDPQRRQAKAWANR